MKPNAKPIIFSGPMIRALLDGRKTQTRRLVRPFPFADSWISWNRLAANKRRPSPYGQVGDLLWVHECWSRSDWTRPKPSIHMPRSASRLTLRIADVRMERLQEISPEDAIREGMPFGTTITHRSDPILWFRREWESINGPYSWDANPWVWALSFEALNKPKEHDMSGTEKVFDGDKLIIVEDLSTGLMWDVAEFGNRQMTHAEAQKACAALRTGGYSDWRLPTMRELLTLVDYSRHDPAIDTELFPNCKSDWYWTSTPYAPDSGYAWFVSFDDGCSNFVRRDHDHCVRAVRAISKEASHA